MTRGQRNDSRFKSLPTRCKVLLYRRASDEFPPIMFHQSSRLVSTQKWFVGTDRELLLCCFTYHPRACKYVCYGTFSAFCKNCTLFVQMVWFNFWPSNTLVANWLVNAFFDTGNYLRVSACWHPCCQHVHGSVPIYMCSDVSFPSRNSSS